MAKGRGDDCLQAGGGRTGVWVALEPPLQPVAAPAASQARRCWSPGAPPVRCRLSVGLGCFLSSLALSTEVSAPDSRMQCRLTLRLFYVTLGMKYKYVQMKACSYCQRGIKLYFPRYVHTHTPQMHTRSFHQLELPSFYALKASLIQVTLL